MFWQLLVVLHIITSSLIALLTRKIAIGSRRFGFAICLISYTCIALAGFVYALLHFGGVAPLPAGMVWLFLVVEGFCLPAAWLCQFRLVSYVGAANGSIVSTFYSIGAAILAIILLDEVVSWGLVVGGLFLIVSVYVALKIKPDEVHQSSSSLQKKLLLVLGGLVFFSVGIVFEKRAINLIGPWAYLSYGWLMQFFGALAYYVLFGFRQISQISTKARLGAMSIGFTISIAGLFFILAVGRASLSQTIIATSGKIALTMLLAAIFLRERNNMPQRLIAFGLASFGVFCIMI